MNGETFVIIKIGDVNYKIRWYWIYADMIGRIAKSYQESDELFKKAEGDFAYGMELFNKSVKLYGMGVMWDKLAPHLHTMDEKPLYELPFVIEEKDATNA